MGKANYWSFDPSDWVSTPDEPPAKPNLQEQVNEWASVAPTVYDTQMQYMLKLAQAQKTAMESLYPTTAGLQESLAGQAVQGMQSGVPQYMQDQWQSNMNAQLGSNAGSPIGADYMSRGLMGLQQDWKQYYQQMAMSLAGRQPLASPGLDYMQNFSPNAAMQSGNQNYGTQAGIYGNNLAQGNPMMSLIGGIGGTMLGGWAGGALGSQLGSSFGSATNTGGTLSQPKKSSSLW